MTGNAVALLYPGCTVSEIAFAADRLVAAGATVQWWTATGESVIDTVGLNVSPTTGISTNVMEATAEADVILVPGGDPKAIIGRDDIASALRAADNRGTVLAAICAGVLVLADAGLTAERHITHNYRRPFAPADIEAFTARFWANAVVEQDPDVGVVVDRNLITALPSAVVEFAETTAAAMPRDPSVERR